MPRFYYDAIDYQGRRMPGILDCESEQRLIGILEDKGQTLVRASTRPLASGQLERRLAARSPGAAERATFAAQMARLLRSGCPIDRALELVEETVQSAPMSDAVEAMRFDVTEGASFSEALARHAGVFPPLFVATVRAGDAGGFLAAAFSRLADYEQKRHKLRRKLVQSLIYPSFMVATMVACIAVVFIFVVPTLVEFLAETNTQLPLPTRILLQVSAGFPRIALALAAAAVLLWGAHTALARSPRYRAWEDRIRLDLPIFGRLTRVSILGQICRTLSMLLASGVSLPRALEVTIGGLGNRVFRQELSTVAEQVQAGEPLSRCLEVCVLFPRVLAGQVRFGEETGSVDKVLEGLADDYESTFEAALESAVGMLEPVLIVGMGLVMGAVVIALFMPMTQMVAAQ